ncbi:SigB/SigF/SigG family RNA polymerase sigma factor [Planosporangium sp. 12N6]|uniref:SigB/SigF/SigG family RNA polymerase sigma factor n=1 Tax=Planosporangium spinosum TaxID=3402278 RepID=UPI003CF143EE
MTATTSRDTDRRDAGLDIDPRDAVPDADRRKVTSGADRRDAAPGEVTGVPTAVRPDGGRSGAEAEVVVRALLTRLADLPADSPDRQRVRDRLIELHLPLAEYLARRFRNRGEPLDDLVQVANLALVKSVDGYDPGRGTGFGSYAVPMILGELKRHFRDKGWDIRVPRRVQELRMEITRTTGELAQRLGHSPTVADLAVHLGIREEDVVEGLDSAHAYRTLSLQTPLQGQEPNATELADLMGEVDRRLERVEDRESLRPLIARLPRREQRIIALRFFGNMTQCQIAAELGISQMHVSRLLAHALRELRSGLLS